MAREFTNGFYTSKAWLDCRKAYIKSVGGLCENCLTKGIYRAGKVVHHKKIITPENINNPTVTLNPDNLKLVCQDCHAEEHKKGKNNRFRFDKFGNVVEK